MEIKKYTNTTVHTPKPLWAKVLRIAKIKNVDRHTIFTEAMTDLVEKYKPLFATIEQYGEDPTN